MASTFEREALHLFRKQFAAGQASTVENRTFLAMVTNNRVSYAIDDGVVRNVLAAARTDPSRGPAPAVVATDLLANSIPFDQSFSHHAIAEKRVLEVELSRAPYQRIAQDYLLAQSSVHSGGILLAPLVKCRDILLLGAYPTEAGDVLAHLITSTRNEMKEYISTTQAMVRLPVIRGPECWTEPLIPLAT